jgi:hypothetical protein
VTIIDWSRYVKCPHCYAELGRPCLALSGVDESGMVSAEAPRPHGGRKLRAASRG